MKRRLSNEKVRTMLAELSSGLAPAEAARKYNISIGSVNYWRRKQETAAHSNGAAPAPYGRVRQLEQENRRLKRLVAELAAMVVE